MPDPRFCARCGTALVAATDPQHRPKCPSCGWFRPTNVLPVVLVLARTDNGKILYTRQPGWPKGAWGLVSGYVEAGESAEQASLREVEEESGLTARAPRLIRTSSSGELLLLWVEVHVQDAAPRAGSDVEAVNLRRPDAGLTPEDWPARAFVEAQLESFSS